MLRKALILTLAIGALPSAILSAGAQTAPPTGTTATRPAKDPPSQSSAPTTAPPASTTQTTGATATDPVVKQMNEEEKAKVESKGK